MIPLFLYTVISYLPMLTKITTIFEEASTALSVYRTIKELSYPQFITRMFSKKLTNEEVELEMTSDWIMLPS